MLTMLFFVLSSGMYSVQADESIGLEFPVEDARAAAQQRRFEFAGIDLAEGIELTGLTEQQSDTVRSKYKIRLLNQRWQSYTNIEDKPDQLVRMRGYATRYNRTMWQEVRKIQLDDLRKYHY